MPLVLYRKYRPKNFSEVVGQEHIVQTITNALVNDLISHCYLFTGPKGSGKTTIARLLAKAANCQNPKKHEPCNECSACLEINRGSAIDLIEIDAASNRGIDDVRELREGIRFAPTRLKYKVFIIDESHQLSKDAANALLKMLEEPPSYVLFILATTELHKMIPTIVSRCQRFDFRKLSALEILNKLEKIVKAEKIKAEKPVLEMIAANAEGALRNAEVLLDQSLSFAKTLDKQEIKSEDIKQLLGIIDSEIITNLLDSVFEKKPGQALELLGQSIEKGADPAEIAKGLVEYLRQALIFKINPETLDSAFINLTQEAKERLKEQTSKTQENDIRKALKSFLEAQNKIKYASIPQLPLELAILEIIEK